MLVQNLNPRLVGVVTKACQILRTQAAFGDEMRKLQLGKISDQPTGVKGVQDYVRIATRR